MSEARTDTTQTRPPGAGAGAEAGGSGKHRGGVAPDDSAAQPLGRHRRTSEEESRAA
ncbi:hypothetical protein ACFVQ0_20730 [Streptomyces sp. NPDC057900]|uniref:hypothetical protein n=1 Tax=Streptomyces sp. NPDC057900 TaxID=3346274 RepID=UPI0036E5E20F